MTLGLITLAPAGGIAMLARAAFGVAILFLALPVVCSMWSLRKTGKPDPEDPVDMDALWKRYKRGEISWDEYLRGEVEGARGLVGTKVDPNGDPTPYYDDEP